MHTQTHISIGPSTRDLGHTYAHTHIFANTYAHTHIFSSAPTPTPVRVLHGVTNMFFLRRNWARAIGSVWEREECVRERRATPRSDRYSGEREWTSQSPKHASAKFGYYRMPGRPLAANLYRHRQKRKKALNRGRPRWGTSGRGLLAKVLRTYAHTQKYIRTHTHIYIPPVYKWFQRYIRTHTHTYTYAHSYV